MKTVFHKNSNYKLLFILVMFLLLLMQGNIAHAQWVQTNGPYGDTITSFAVIGTNIFAGTSHNGVYLSTNNGESWTAVNTGLKNHIVLSLAVSGTNLFAGTKGDGIWKLPLSGIVSVQEDEKDGMPTIVSLGQNYPNPFNPLTTIPYSLSQSTHIKVDVFACNGQHIATLVDEKVAAGSHSVEFNGSNCASGIYVYRFVTPESIKMGKMLLVK